MGLRVMPSLLELTAQQQEEIRQACGFACVRCGVTIYRYLRLPEGNLRIDSGNRQHVSGVPCIEPSLP